MIFWNKKKEVILDCFTWSEIAFENAKIERASKYFPEWWKKLSKTVSDGRGTIKNCVGFTEYYKRGIIIPSWFEMNLIIRSFKNTEQLFAWEVSNKDVSTEDSHTSDQFNGFSIHENYSTHNIKFCSPWHLKTKDEIYFSWSQPIWNQQSLASKLTLVPGITEFKYQHAAELNYFFCRKEEDELINIPPLTPLAILHPMTEKKIVLKHHLISREEFSKKFDNKMLLFNNNFYKKKRKLADMQESQKKKCPFHYD